MSPPIFTALPDWSGSTAVVIGGGPSLDLKQVRKIGLSRLEQKCRVVAVNDAVFVSWWADWLHGCDAKWWMWHRNTAQRFPGIKTTLGETVPAPWVSGRLVNSGPDGFDPTPGNVRTGSNGVYQVMHELIKAGVSRIILTGVVMSAPVKGDTHWHGSHEGRPHVDYAQKMIPAFATLKPALQEYGVDVVNCSPGSALHAFRHGDLETELP